MTLQDHIPLVDFYKIYLEHLKKSKYRLLLCLIARKADAPLLYKEIRENWSSFHDVTGDNILFMFAGENLDDIGNEQSLTYKNLDFKRDYFGHWMYLSLYNDCLVFDDNAGTNLGFMDYDFMLRIGEGHPRLNSNEEFSRVLKYKGIRNSLFKYYIFTTKFFVKYSSATRQFNI